MNNRLSPVLLLLLILIGPSSKADDFDYFSFKIPSSVYFGLQGDSQKTRSLNLGLALNVYKNNFLELSVSKTLQKIDDEESYQVQTLLMGYRSDPLNKYSYEAEYFETSVDELTKLIQGRLGAAYNGADYTLGLYLGLLSNQFSTTEIESLNILSHKKTYTGIFFGFRGEYFYRKWGFFLQAISFSYNEDLSIFEDELISFFVPIESINLITGQSQLNINTRFSYSFKSASLALLINYTKGESSGVASLGTGFDVSYSLTKDWMFSAQFGRLQSLEDELSDSPLRTFGLSSSYSF